MSRRVSLRLFYVFGSAAVAGGVTWWASSRFRRWRNATIERLRAGSQVRQTACGEIEYATLGEGPPVLVSHGMMGGYDQGLAIAELIGLPNFRFISVSRPGYLRTPLKTGPTFEEQADAFAALLDSLGISRAAIIGISAGGPPAMDFARRHPDRCAGLVLMSAVTRRLRRNEVDVPRAMSLSTSALADFGYWMLRPIAARNPRLAAAGMLLDAEVLMLQDLSIKSPFLKLTESFVPLSVRRRGMRNDEIQILSLPESVPPVTGPRTLIIHGTMDKLVPYDNAVAAAQAITSAELMPIEGGGHLTAIFNAPRIRSAIAPFLK